MSPSILASTALVSLLLAGSAAADATKIIDRRDAEAGARFPVLEAENLRGRTLRLPDDLAGDINLLLVAYERDQQADIDTWLGPLAKIPLETPHFAYYELPTISRGMAWMRGVIDGGMRQGIPDREQRERTITLYLDKDWFRHQIGTDGSNAIAALLVDRDGHVTQRWFGPFDATADSSLRTALGLTLPR